MTLIKTLTDNQVSILTTYFSGQKSVQAEDSFENWTVINGAFNADLTSSARLEIISYLSSANCTGYIRVYDITQGSIANRVVSTSIISNKLVASKVLGPTFQLTSGHIYEIQMRCDGADNTDSFTVLNIVPREQ